MHQIPQKRREEIIAENKKRFKERISLSGAKIEDEKRYGSKAHEFLSARPSYFQEVKAWKQK